MQIITFVTIYAVLSQMTFLSQNTRFSRHFWVCYQAPITFNDVCIRGSNLHGAPYDFRKAAHEHEDYFNRVKRLVEETYEANEATPVILLTHSLGSPMMLYFLFHQRGVIKKRSFYGQADRKGLPPPPYGQGVVIFFKIS